MVFMGFARTAMGLLVGGCFFCSVALAVSATSNPSLAATTIHVDAGGVHHAIDRQTLAVDILTTAGEKIVLSAPAFQGGEAKDFVTTEEGVQWTLATGGSGTNGALHSLKLKIRVKPVGDELEVALSPQDAQTSVTWPVQPLNVSSGKSLLWPRGEGNAIPLDDAQWRDFLRAERWDTLESLGMPLWGIVSAEGVISCVVQTQFRNSIEFAEANEGEGLTLSFTHEFRPSEERWLAFRFQFEPGKDASLIRPALNYRAWLKESGAFRTLEEKAVASPAIRLLAGAPHVYLWGGGSLTRFDLTRGAANKLAARLVQQVASAEASPGKQLQKYFTKDEWAATTELAGSTYQLPYAQAAMCAALSRGVESADFYDPAAWINVELTTATRGLLSESLEGSALVQRNCRLPQEAFPDFLPPVEKWGGSFSSAMLDAFSSAGLNRLRLGLDGVEALVQAGKADFVRDAVARGYLLGPYDSYHSIHNPATSGTDSSWPTAQFDAALFATGGIMNADGTMRKGFKQRGYLLSPLAARPYVERRVRANFDAAPYNYYFFDCDGFGQVYDDYSPAHRATCMADAAARVDRMAWVARTFGAAVGTEGGSAYAVPAVALFEGVFAENFGWGDTDMSEKASPYYVGRYYPTEAPDVFFKAVPAKEKYVRGNYDPRYRVPLWEAAFHDAAVSGHHWSAASLKFSNVETTVALTELLYQVPPMYHLNPEVFAKQKAKIMKHVKAWAPAHEVSAFLPLTDFVVLSEDKRVQRTSFGDRLVVTVNYGAEDFAEGGDVVPAGGAVMVLDGKRSVVR